MKRTYRTIRQKDRAREELWGDIMLLAGVVLTVMLWTLAY